MDYGDCGLCKNLNSGLCDDCEYSPNLQDNWEKASPEILAQREQEEKEKAQREAISETLLSIELPDEFRETFNKAKKCAAEIHHRTALMGVHIAAGGHLVASDTYRLVELQCDCVPKELVDKNIIMLGENQASVCKGEFPDYKKFLNIKESQNTVPLGSFQIKEFKNPLPWTNEVGTFLIDSGNNMILLNKSYLDAMQETLTGVLGGDIRVSYNPNNNRDFVLFTGDNGRMVIGPIRYEPE